MAADNWGVCPKCEKERIFDAKKRTLREDWDIGINPDGEFWVIYSAQCKECGFSHKFNHEVQLEIK